MTLRKQVLPWPSVVAAAAIGLSLFLLVGLSEVGSAPPLKSVALGGYNLASLTSGNSFDAFKVVEATCLSGSPISGGFELLGSVAPTLEVIGNHPTATGWKSAILVTGGNLWVLKVWVVCVDTQAAP